MLCPPKIFRHFSIVRLHIRGRGALYLARKPNPPSFKTCDIGHLLLSRIMRLHAFMVTEIIVPKRKAGCCHWDDVTQRRWGMDVAWVAIHCSHTHTLMKVGSRSGNLCHEYSKRVVSMVNMGGIETAKGHHAQRNVMACINQWIHAYNILINVILPFIFHALLPNAHKITIQTKLPAIDKLFSDHTRPQPP